MGDVITELISIKDMIIEKDSRAVDKINELIKTIESLQDIEIAPAQEDILAMDPCSKVIITGENAHVRIYMAPQGENTRPDSV